MTTHSPTTLNLKSFHPPVRILMGPGPSEVHPQVLAAQARPTIGHLDPAFVAMMDETKALLQYAFQTRNAATFPVSAPGSAGMEACFANLVEPGEKVVVCINGVFGARMKENVERAGGVAVVVSDDWGKPVDPQKLKTRWRPIRTRGWRRSCMPRPRPASSPTPLRWRRSPTATIASPSSTP